MASFQYPYSPVTASQSFPPPPRASSFRALPNHTPSSSLSQRPLPPTPSPEPKHHHLRGRSFFQVWWKELGTCFLILAALFAIVGTVAPYQDQPLPQWPYDLSINTLVSIYVAILKFAMAFVLAECIGQIKWTWFEHPRPLTDLVPYDDASRGSLWGSLKLLWMLRGRSALASVGAIVTVLSAIIDPFAQQLVQYNACSQPGPAQNASLPVSNTWMSTGAANGPGSNNLGYEMQAAIMSGLLSQQPFDPPFICTTGNCTFDDTYYSVAYCSVCDDVTDEIVALENGPVVATMTSPMQITYIGTTSTLIATETAVDDNDNPVSTATETMLFTQTATTQSGVSVQTAVVKNGGQQWKLPSGLTADGPDGNFQMGVYMNNSAGSIGIFSTNMEFIYALPKTSNQTLKNDSDTLWVQRGLGAARCQLRPCVQGFKASVQNGKFVETKVEDTFEMPWYYDEKSAGIVLARTACVTDPNQRLALSQQAANRSINGKLPEWFQYNPGQYNLTNNPNMPENCTYSMSTTSLVPVNAFFQTFFNGSIHQNQGGQTATSRMQQDAFFRSNNITFGTVNSTVANITRSMTNTMRQTFNPWQVVGKSTIQSTCVHADWRWLSFPATLVGLTLLCFLLTSIVTHRRAVDDLRSHDFKTAVLPLMFAASKLHELPPDVQCSGVQDKIEKSLKQRHVRFTRGDDGWHFTEEPAVLP